MARLELERTYGSVVFWLPEGDESSGRVFGAIKDAAGRRWVYPAYPPVGLIVLEDLAKTSPHLSYSDEVREWAEYLKKVPELVAQRSLPETSLPVKPFEHQLEGLAHLYHTPRAALLWEPGVGKTKVLCDLKYLLGPSNRMLVLAPRVVVSTWLREVAFHSGGIIKAAAVDGTPAKKRSVIKDHKNYDVLVATYGTARTMGIPRLCKKAETLLASAGHPSAKLAAQAIRYVPDADDQVSLVEQWARGRTVKDIEAEIANRDPGWLSDIDYSVIVADESHNIKEMTSKQTRAALDLSAKAYRRYVMSGTPTLGDPRHLYPQLKFLSPALMPENWYTFKEKFLIMSSHSQHVVAGYKNLHIINSRVDRVALRKKKEECLDLPERHVINVHVEPSSAQAWAYDQLLREMQADLDQYMMSRGSEGRVVACNAAVRLNKLSQILSGFVYVSEGDEAAGEGQVEVKTFDENPKLEALQELLEGILEDPAHKVIVWCVYVPEIQMVQELLKKRGTRFIKLDGSTSGKSGRLLEEFKTDPDCRVLIGQIGTGVGFTANSATYTIYFNLDWSLDKYLQSIDRNYRAGQDKKVTVYRLLCSGSVDIIKAHALDHKQNISELMTKKIACATCENYVKCQSEGIEIFSRKCQYSKSALRLVARPATLRERG